MVFSYSKGKLRKVDQTTILANGFKGTLEPTFISPDGKFYIPQTVGKQISTFRILKTEN
jgi:6-phosphogluconolactonase